MTWKKWRGSEESVNRRTILRAGGASLAGLSLAGANAAAAATDEIPVPTGELVDPSRVHEVGRAGRGVTPEEVRADRPDVPAEPASEATREPVPDTSDWWAWTRDHFKNGTYQQMDCDFNVPSEPGSSDGPNEPVMFLFPALQNCDDFCTNAIYILQPVLQWNWSSSYADEWSIASWYKGPDGNFYHSTPITVSVGDSLWGYMFQRDDYSWYIQTYNNSTTEYTDIYTEPYDSSLSFDRAFTTLEVANYEPGTCNRLPGDCTFENIYLEDTNGNRESPEWGTHVNGSAECNVDATVIDDQTTKTTTPN